MTVEKGNEAGISEEATTTSGVARSGGERSEPERSDAPDVAPPDPAPNPEVQEKAVRRQFSAKYKARILEKADACKGKHGALGELLRKEGLYASQVAAWRKQREKGQLQGLGPKKRGRKGSGKPQKSQREKELEREVRRLNRRNDKLELMLEIQKKTSELLGIPMEPLDLDEKS
ncbi:MAG TPA: hypothetical protein VM425_06430 [Myxococcota bacterium]|nr:hypothetical protein [Myxococcota bacterium]